jgi:O-antigen/teichoic acid export membrane protein
MKTVSTIYTANQEPMYGGLFSLLGQILSMVIILILTKTTVGNFLYIALAFSGSPIIIYFLSYPIAFHSKYKELRPSIKLIDLSLSKDIVGWGLKFFFIQICFLVLYQSSNIIITNIFSPNEVTPYNIAYKYMTMLPMIFVILVSPLWTAITDAYVKSDILWIKKTINKMLYVWLLCSFGAIIFVFISSPVIKIWIGDAVDIPKSYFIALSVFAIVDMWNKLFSSFSNGVARLKSQICATILEAVIFIPLAILFAKIMGVVGVAWALAIVSIIPAVFISIDYLLFLKVFKDAR